MDKMSLIEAKNGYDKLTTSLKDIEEKLKELRAETKKTLSLLPAAVLPCDTEEETQEAARYFYWQCPKITTTAIKDALKLEMSSSLFDYVGPFIQEKPCETCGNILKVKKRSRSSHRTETEKCQICLTKEKERKEQAAQLVAVKDNVKYNMLTPKTLHEQYGQSIYRRKHPSIKQLMAWADGELSKPSLILLGDVGVGKTALALWAIHRYARRINKAILLIKYPDFSILDIYTHDNWSETTQTEKDQLIHIVQRTKLLMIDNLGHMALPVWAAAPTDKQEILLRILDYRTQYEFPTLIVTALTNMRLRAQFNDAIAGRLTESFSWVEMDGPDLRNLPVKDIIEVQAEWKLPQTEIQRQALTATKRRDFRTQAEYKKMINIEQSLAAGSLPIAFWENRLWSANRYNWSLPKLLKYTLDEQNLKRWEAKQRESTEKTLEYSNGMIEKWDKSMPYDEYLQTEHWQNIRKQALQKANHKCQLCANDDDILHVHHKTYANLWNEQEDDLIVLCEGCHERHHDKIKA